MIRYSFQAAATKAAPTREKLPGKAEKVASSRTRSFRRALLSACVPLGVSCVHLCIGFDQHANWDRKRSWNGASYGSSGYGNGKKAKWSS